MSECICSRGVVVKRTVLTHSMIGSKLQHSTQAPQSHNEAGEVICFVVHCFVMTQVKRSFCR